jgi:hypothetical protein
MYLKHWSDPAANRAELRRRIEEALAELTEREERLRTGREAVERSVAQDKALLIADPQVARLWIRYHAESNSLYFRASRELLRSLVEDEAETHQPDDQERADAAESEGPETALSPNEANGPSGPPLNGDLVESSDVSAAVILQPVLASTCATPVPPEVPNVPEGVPAPPEVLTAVSSTPAPEVANALSPNEANDLPEPHLIPLMIDFLDTRATLKSSPLTARMVARLKLMQRTDLPAAQQDQLLRDHERDIVALEGEIERMQQRLA